MDRTFYFGGDPRSRKSRNLGQNPNVAVHLESGDEVVILEGVAEVVADPNPALTELVSAAKYGVRSGSIEGSYAVRPHVVFAWLESSFQNTATRWVFSAQGLEGHTAAHRTLSGERAAGPLRREIRPGQGPGIPRERARPLL